MTDLPMTKADDDLVELLRGCAEVRTRGKYAIPIEYSIYTKAADAITSLRAQLAADRDVLDDYPNLVRERNDLRAQLAAAEATIADVKIEAGYSDICSWPLSHSVTLLKARLAAAESQLQAMRKALEEIKSWKYDTLGERPRKDTEYRDPKADEAFDRGTRMAFFRCADRADEALRSLTEGAGK